MIERRVLAEYAPLVVPLRVEALGNRGGFSGARIWRVTTDQGDYALRQWPNPGLPRDRILGLHRLLEHLRNEGLPFVAVPLTASNGTTLQNAGHEWQLEAWMPGVASFRNDPTLNRLRAAMVALAQWHLAASRFDCNTISTKSGTSISQWFSNRGPCVSPTVAERFAHLQGAGDGQLHRVEKRICELKSPTIRVQTSRILELFRLGRATGFRELELVRDVEVRLQPCLRDIWHDHVLFVGDSVTGLIDPAACRTESVACDLSRLIGSLVGDDPAQWAIAIEEYHRCRPLTTGERALITVFNRTGVLLSGWTWLEWLCLERRPFPDLDAVETRLNEILSRMEALVAVVSVR